MAMRPGSALAGASILRPLGVWVLSRLDASQLEPLADGLTGNPEMLPDLSHAHATGVELSGEVPVHSLQLRGGSSGSLLRVGHIALRLRILCGGLPCVT